METIEISGVLGLIAMVVLTLNIVMGILLSTAYKKYTGKDLEGAHRADVDIRATMEIFQKQKELYDMPTTAKEIDDVVNESRKDQVDLSGKYKFAEINGKREIVFNFGKNKGKPFKEVYETDARYKPSI